MAKDAKQYGPTAERVATNVRALREARGLGLAGLSERLAALGQPIALGALSKVELGQRRVDVDDLVALAIALDVSPSRLLLPAGAVDGERVGLAPDMTVTEREAWAWAAGDAPLPDVGERAPFDVDRLKRFSDESRPHQPRDVTPLAELAKRREELAPLVAGYRQARAGGLSHGALVSYLDLLDTMRDLVEVARQEKGGDDGER